MDPELQALAEHVVERVRTLEIALEACRGECELLATTNAKLASINRALRDTVSELQALYKVACQRPRGSYDHVH